MKNRLFTIILSIVLLLSLMAPLASSAAQEIKNADGGGFDYYSVTFHYDTPTVVQYKNVSNVDSKKDKLIPSYTATGKKSYTEGYIFADPEDTFTVSSGYSLGPQGTAYNTYKSAAKDISKSGYEGNYIGITGNGHVSDIYYTTYPNQYGYIFNIHDNDLIQTLDPVSLRGVTEIVDDAGTFNPNIEIGEDGYAKDINGGRIDDNGYLLDENDEWYSLDSNGKKEKLQLFKVIGSDILPMPRFNQEGRIIKTSQYEGAMVFVVDENGNVAKDTQGNDRRGTPAIGIPVMKTKITKITFEIDALGSQLYNNVSDDPQQKNTITLSVGNAIENIETIPECGTVVGTAKCITTRTEATFGKKDVPTVQSVEIEANDEILNNLSCTASKIFVRFGVEELQGAGAYKKRYIMANDQKTGMKKSEIKILSSDDRSSYVTPSPEPPTTSDSIFSVASRLYLIIGGAAILVVIIVIIIIIVVVNSKNKKKKGSKK